MLPTVLLESRWVAYGPKMGIPLSASFNTSSPGGSLMVQKMDKTPPTLVFDGLSARG